VANNNPLIALGSLNRLVASVTWPAFPALNVTVSFLNREAIRLALDGEATAMLPALTGMVTSPNPYQGATLTIHLLKTQPLSNLYKQQYELNTLLGDCTVRPDVPVGLGLQPYDLTNMALEGVRELSFAGEDAGWVIMCRGTYLINSSLWP
jgi:hypothetical protein